MLDDDRVVHGFGSAPLDAYLICPGCLHCFVTEDELTVRDQLARLQVGGPGERGDPLPASEITRCPLCGNDL